MRTVANAVNLFNQPQEGNQMSNAKFEVGTKVIIARPIGNPQLAGIGAVIKSGIDKFKAEEGYWVTGYHIEIDGQAGKLFVAAESELEAA
jgi:hypothetical protein